MNKVGIIGVGMVGSSYAYSLINQNLVDELVLVDRKEDFTNAQAEDLLHGTVFLDKQPKIYAGDYADLEDADIICITSGASQQPGETRLDLLKKNAKIMVDIIKQIKHYDFRGVLLIAANPVDILTQVAQDISGYDKHRVIGSGTVLDSARFRQNLSRYLEFNPTQINANIIGEHGDSSIPIWSTARVGNKLILDLFREMPGRVTYEGLEKCYTDARDSAYEIIKAKGATHYGIGIALSQITKAILYNQNTILPVSVRLNGEYRQKDVCLAVPAIVNKRGISEIFENQITEEEYLLLSESAENLKKHYQEVVSDLY